MPRSKYPVSVTRHALAVSFDAHRDRLTVCEFGTLPERRLPSCTLPINDHLSFFVRRPRGTVVGFELRELYKLDVDAELPSLWTGPRFRVPTLGLRSAEVAAIALRARTVLAGRSTPDVVALARADELFAMRDFAGVELALRDALAAGSLLAHLTLAGHLTGRGRYQDAYDHARVFTELAPRDSRGWACLGRACLELGDVGEAHGALRRSVRLEHEGSYETFASILLQSLGTGASEQPR
ncbi:MAG: hypothetical protein ACR2LK_08280 [Solirubrobacteraceae bacterium]